MAIGNSLNKQLQDEVMGKDDSEHVGVNGEQATVSIRLEDQEKMMDAGEMVKEQVYQKMKQRYLHLKRNSEKRELIENSIKARQQDEKKFIDKCQNKLEKSKSVRKANCLAKSLAIDKTQSKNPDLKTVFIHSPDKNGQEPP